MNTNWSSAAWYAIEDIFKETINHPFVKGIADGTLSSEKFDYYIKQDSLYLRSYYKVLAHIASRIKNTDFANDFINFAANGIAVEEALHKSLLSQSQASNRIIDDNCKSPACTLYTSTLLAQAYEPVEVEVAAVLPCFWVYKRVGEHILKSISNINDNPYQKWIYTYGDETFAESTRRAIEIADSLASETTEAIRKQMIEIFRMCAKMEWLFWDSAWNLEQWKI